MNAGYALRRYTDSLESLERLRLELDDVLAQYNDVGCGGHAMDGMPRGSGISNSPLILAERSASLDREVIRIRRSIAFHERIRNVVDEYLSTLDILEEKVIRLRYFGPRRTWDDVADMMFLSRRTVTRLHETAISRWHG